MHFPSVVVMDVLVDVSFTSPLAHSIIYIPLFLSNWAAPSRLVLQNDVYISPPLLAM